MRAAPSFAIRVMRVANLAEIAHPLPSERPSGGKSVRDPAELIEQFADKRLRNQAIVELVGAMLRDPVAKVRRHAVHALSCGLCKPDRCTLDIDIEQQLRDVLASDPDEKVRREAADGLARMARAEEAEGA